MSFIIKLSQINHPKGWLDLFLGYIDHKIAGILCALLEISKPLEIYLPLELYILLLDGVYLLQVLHLISDLEMILYERSNQPQLSKIRTGVWSCRLILELTNSELSLNCLLTGGVIRGECILSWWYNPLGRNLWREKFTQLWELLSGRAFIQPSRWGDETRVVVCIENIHALFPVGSLRGLEVTHSLGKIISIPLRQDQRTLVQNLLLTYHLVFFFEKCLKPVILFLLLLDKSDSCVVLLVHLGHFPHHWLILFFNLHERSSLH